MCARRRLMRTRLTDIETKAQLTSDRDRHRLTQSRVARPILTRRLTNIKREAQLTSDRDRHRMSL